MKTFEAANKWWNLIFQTQNSLALGLLFFVLFIPTPSLHFRKIIWLTICNIKKNGGR